MWTVILCDAQGHELRRQPLGEAPLVVGRGKDRGLVLDSPAVSRQHARLQALGSEVTVEDLGSANGTLLNGRRLERAETLREGDELRIADFLLRLRRDAAPQQPRIQLPEQPPAPAAAEPPAGGWSSASELLREQVNSIRSFRDESRSGDDRLPQFEREWDKVVASMRELQQQLQGHPRVLQFGISRNQREITVKLADPAAKRGHAYLILSPEHPEGKYRDQLTVWLREFGEPDLNYDQPAEAMRHFVQRIASRLA